MKKSLVLFGIILGMFLITNISAGIYFSQPLPAYNLGDIITNDINIEPVEEGFLKIELICDGDSILVIPKTSDGGKVHIEFPLTPGYIQDLRGDCYFYASYPNGTKTKSREFEISNKLLVRLDFDSLFIKPGEEITISGIATKLNGNGANGEIEIVIPALKLVEQTEENNTEENNTESNMTETNETETSEENPRASVDNGVFYGQVQNGSFSVKINLAEDSPAGDYKIEIDVYEGTSAKRISEGEASANLQIAQVLKSVDLAISDQNVDPGEEFSFKPRLLDQSGLTIVDEISIIIRNEDLERIFEEIVQSDETIKYNVPTNISAGYYEAEASRNNLTILKKFYINEKAKVSFVLENNTLTVTNIGNIPYDQDIQINLNGKPFVKRVNLALGEVQQFKLSGEGETDVKISDGETEYSSSVALTGNAIGVKELKNGASIAIGSPIIWIFFIIILGGGLLFLFKNIFKKRSFAYPFQDRFLSKVKVKDLTIGMTPARENTAVMTTASKRPGSIQKSEVRRSSMQKSTTRAQEISKTTSTPREAEQVLVLKGQKSSAAVLVLKIKNKLSETAKQSLEMAIEPVYEKKGAVYEQGDYIFAIFSPLMTKTFKNEIEAAKVAEKISMALKMHNQKFTDKIEFGIGINSGEIVDKVEDKRLKFTALGTLISGAKRLAESSKEQILMTKEAFHKGASELKAEKREALVKTDKTDKKDAASGEFYELRSIVDSEGNKKFIDSFLRRMSKEERNRMNN